MALNPGERIRSRKELDAEERKAKAERAKARATQKAEDAAAAREQRLADELAAKPPTPSPPEAPTDPGRAEPPRDEEPASPASGCLVVASILCSLIAIGIFPPVFGFLAFVCAIGVAAFGDRGVAPWLMALAAACTVGGMAWGYHVWSRLLAG